jgi:hypothetical protein
VLVGQIRDSREVSRCRCGQKLRSWVAIKQFKYPTLRDVREEESQYGKAQSQEMMQLVDQAGALANGSLKSARDLTQQSQLSCHLGSSRRPFRQGETSPGFGLDGVRFLAAKKSDTIALVALRIATRKGDVDIRDGMSLLFRGRVELIQKVDQVVGILASRVETNDKGDSGVSLSDPKETLFELGIAFGGLGKGEFLGSGLEVFVEKDGIMAIA